MKQIVPTYYPEFHCIADACRHSCCIGWEIDIDSDKLEYYRSIGGAFGVRLRENIDTNGNSPHFRLGASERCPFLNGCGLCDLIIELGEDALCGICTDHPRFRNAFSDRTELGLGLCCEEAARIVLSCTDPVSLAIIDDDGGHEQPDEDEAYLFTLRANAFAIAQDRDFPLPERMENLSDFFGFPLPEADPAKWADIYLELERLDPAWTVQLEHLKVTPTSPLSPDWDTPFEQLLVYFLYRHLPAALYDGDVESKIAFAVLSTTLLRWLFSVAEKQTLPTLTELVRMYSAEIEYSDENPEILFDILYQT